MKRLIVFDLDLRLWHCGPLLWCDQLTPPVRMDAVGRVISACGTQVRLYPEVPELLDELSSRGHALSLASRTSAPAIAGRLLDLFGIARHFQHPQIYPGDKSVHFEALHRETGVAYRNMMYFDDEERNIESVSRLGVRVALVKQGMTRGLLESALDAG